jgi:calcineurin-binding protein cabin-1
MFCYGTHMNYRYAMIFCCSKSIDQGTKWISGYIHPGNFPVDAELDEMQSCIDSALDQTFFCLYGLKINPDSCSEDDLAVHKNTSRGDYQTKEQCADVFQYVLPYAKALSVSKHLMRTLLFVTFGLLHTMKYHLQFLMSWSNLDLLFQKTGLVKLRRVLRALRKLFPHPPHDLLINNPIDNFLDGPDSCEKALSKIYESDGSKEAILNVLFPGEGGYEAFKKLSTSRLSCAAIGLHIRLPEIELLVDIP